MSDRPLTLVEKFQGALLGAAVGDALGLPREGLSPSRATRLFGTAPLKHSLVFHKGLTSDDTEHACMVGQSLLVSHDNPTLFARVLAWKLRFWLLGLPAGVGFATLRSILKLWLGFSPQSSGVFSAGNGPAMRAPILGVYASSLPDPKTFLQQFVTASTQITHSDPAALHGALAIAFAAAYNAQIAPEPPNFNDFIDFIKPELQNTPLFALISNMEHFLNQNATLDLYLQSLNLHKGVTGYINHTVPAVLYCFLRHPSDFQTAIEQIILAGGDTDTTAAILGGILGANLGPERIPKHWLNNLISPVPWPTGLVV